MSKDNRRPPLGKSVVRGLALMSGVVNVFGRRHVCVHVAARGGLMAKTFRIQGQGRVDLRNALEWIEKTEGWNQEGR